MAATNQAALAAAERRARALDRRRRVASVAALVVVAAGVAAAVWAAVWAVGPTDRLLADGSFANLSRGTARTVSSLVPVVIGVLGVLAAYEFGLPPLRQLVGRPAASDGPRSPRGWRVVTVDASEAGCTIREMIGRRTVGTAPPVQANLAVALNVNRRQPAGLPRVAREDAPLVPGQKLYLPRA